MKPYFCTKGQYKDGRKKIVIRFEKQGFISTQALPKPEKLLEVLERLEREKFERKKVMKSGTAKPLHFGFPKGKVNGGDKNAKNKNETHNEN